MQRKVFFAAVGIIAILGLGRSDLRGQGVGGPVEIPITVSDWSNIARTNEPVTSGVPIPSESVGADWALFDGQTEIPLQATILPGIKAPWALLDFQTDTAAGGTKSLTLKQQTPTAVPVDPVEVTEDTSQITVSTGPVQTQLSKTDFNLLDTVWLDSNSDGTYTNGERVVLPSVTSNLIVQDAGSASQFSGRGNQTSINWEYQGPLRVTLRVDGAYKNGAATLLNYTTRLTWYAGQTNVRIEHLVRNSLATQERWVKLSSARLHVGTTTMTDRIAKSGDTVWTNRATGTSLELIPPTLVISDEYDPYGSPPVERQQQTLNVDVNGGMIIADQSYHSATIQLDFASNLSGAEQTRRTTAAKDPLIALAPESQYSKTGAFGHEKFGTYTDEKNTYTKWGWTWPTADPWNPWSYEHNRPRVQDMYVSWSESSANDFEADELWQNIMMLARVRIPYYLDRLRAFQKYWNWQWTYRSDGFDFNGASWHWFYGNGITRTPAIQPTLTEDDTDYIEHNVKLGKGESTHAWNAGAIDYYYLTGDKDSLQAAIDIGEVCQLQFFGSNYNHTPQNTGVSGTGSRHTIRCVYILTRLWEATNDQQWKTAVDGVLPYLLNSPYYDQRGFFYSQPCALPGSSCVGRENGKSFAGFPTAVAMEGLYRYYLLTNHQGVRTQMLQIAQFMRDHALDPVTGRGGASYVVDAPNPGDVYRSPDTYGRDSKTFVNAMVIGYRLTGDTSYLTKAKLAWGRGTKGTQGQEYATDTQVGRFANSLQAWNPYSGLFPEGGDLHYAGLLFYDAARQDTMPPTAVTDLRTQ